MAERRMFAKTIVLSDAFLDMPLSARCLYFTLGMFADDDGFVNSPKGIMRQCGASEDDLKVLLTKRFLLAFESGVIVIKHWRINNYLRNDRYVETKYTDEKAMLSIDQNGAYTDSGIPSNGIPSIGKDSIDKDRLGKDSKGGSGGKTQFSPPTLDEVKSYCKENGYDIDANYFFDHYSGNGWKAGRVPMKDWKATVRNWYRRDQKNKKPTGAKIKTPYDGLRTETKGDDSDRLARMMGVQDG